MAVVGVVHRVVEMVKAVGHDIPLVVAIVGVCDVVDIRIGIDLVMRIVGKIRALLIRCIAQVGIALIGAELLQYIAIGVIRKTIVVLGGCFGLRRRSAAHLSSSDPSRRPSNCYGSKTQVGQIAFHRLHAFGDGGAFEKRIIFF